MEMRLIRLFTAALAIVLGMQSGPVVSGREPLAGQAVAAKVTTRIRVTLPQNDTDLLIAGQAMTGTGTVRVVETPPLEAGKVFRYELTARWRPNTYTVLTRNKTIEFKAGDEVSVDLSTDDPNDRAEIKYVPTPAEIVSEMIALAAVTANDVVFEPGCGDARITIAAIKAGARKGVGIDLDPERVAESQANVKAANLEDKIEIRLGDALDIRDLSDATLVFLYMGDDFNRLIRPILWKQLKVGARIVSHRFTMGDWKPNQTVEVTGGDELGYQLHLWTITPEVKQRVENR